MKMTDEIEEYGERQYEEGRRTTGRRLLSLAIELLDGEELTLARLLKERDETRAVLRRLCEEHGDNDWEDNLYLADALDKHLGNWLNS